MSVSEIEAVADQDVIAPVKKATKKRKASQKNTEELILEHRINARKLSRSILRRWQARLDLEELDSIVDLALCETAARYDATKGASFMTFLYYHLRGYLVRAVDTAANLNTVPAAPFEIAELASNYDSGVTYKNGKYVSATANDIAEALNNNEYQLPDEALYKKQLVGLSNLACAKLDELEKEVVYRIYVQEEPLVDVAKSLGYSRCHISRVKKKALTVLQEEMRALVPEKAKTKEADADIIAARRRALSRRSVTRRNSRQAEREEQLRKIA